MKWNSSVKIGSRNICLTSPTFFIADIAANHDGDFQRACDLVKRAKDAGADAAKFQHFLASKIVSDVGFSTLGAASAHQSSWKKSVVEVYDQYHFRREWTERLHDLCRRLEIEFMTTPYDYEAVDDVINFVPALKIGSGDITWLDFISRCASTGRPILLACGAATMDETADAVNAVLSQTPDVVLMQCNTNYTGSITNFKYVNLNVLKAFAVRWPGMVLGLSDHTPGHSAVLGAVAFGARVIEKHFTDDNSREGPDHKFALNPVNWRAMVEATCELELALGDGCKIIEANERETVIVQRRAIRCVRDLPAGHRITEVDIEYLRPCPPDALTPKSKSHVIGATLTNKKSKGEDFKWNDLALR